MFAYAQNGISKLRAQGFVEYDLAAFGLHLRIGTAIDTFATKVKPFVVLPHDSPFDVAA